MTLFSLPLIVYRQIDILKRKKSKSSIDKVPLTLDDFIKGKTIAVVDIETTGFSHQKDCIVEIGVCELDLNSGICLQIHSKIILYKWDIFHKKVSFPHRYRYTFLSFQTLGKFF